MGSGDAGSLSDVCKIKFINLIGWPSNYLRTWESSEIVEIRGNTAKLKARRHR